MITAMIAAAAIDYAALFDKATTMRNTEFDQHVNRLASAYPGLVKVSELGKTGKGTPIHLLTVTDTSVDDESGKVGYYIQGGIHVKEMSGAPAALYVASRLAETHRPGGILEKSVFYIVPRCVPDGADLMAQTQGNLRSAWGEELKEGDSLLEPCDINGDGKISHMVFEWPTSNLVRSPRDPRCFVHRSRFPEIKGPFYAIMEEGVFHNWNGKLPTLPWPRYFWRQYLDYNRNWEPGWSADTPGAGKAPLNVPETRLQADFLLAHKNIRFAIALHNGYGMVFVSQVRDDILSRYLSVAERLSAMTGFPVLKEWEEHDQKGVANVKRTGFFTEFCYWKAGIPCLTMELGTVETSCGLDAREMFKRADPYTAPYEVIEAEDAHPEFEKSWLPWKKVKHPQLGEVEVGGMLGAVFACPRPRDIEKTSERLFQFVQSHMVDLIADHLKGIVNKTGCPLPLAISTDFPGGNIVVESQTEGEVRVRPDTRTSRGECAPRHWAFRVRGAGGRKVKFQFPHDPIFGFLSIRGPAVSQDEGVTWKWMDGGPNNPSESFEYAFGPDENNVLFAWQPLYTEATLHRFVERINRGGAKICVETLCKTEKGRSAELLRIGDDVGKGKIGVLILTRHHANEIWASFVVQGIIEGIFADSPEGKFLRENVAFFIVPFVDKDGVEDGDPGKDRRPHDHNRDYNCDHYSTVRAIKQKATEWVTDKKFVMGFDMHSCSLEVRGKRLRDEKAWAHNMLFQIVRVKDRHDPAVRRFSRILQEKHQNGHEFIQYLPGSDSVAAEPVSKGDAGKCGCWMYTALNTKYAATLETPFARPDGRPNTPEDAETLGVHIAQAIADFVRETLESKDEPMYETDAMKPFPILRPVPERLADARRGFQSAPSITASPKGRLWAAWHTGDTTEGDENGMVVVSSGDGGETWTPPLFAIDPPGPLRILDPGLWTDPDGKVWLFYAQLYGMWDGRAGVWAMHPLDPEDANTGWTPARRLCHGFMKNKPIVTRDGTWLLPSEFMNGKPWGGRLGAAESIPKEFAFEMPEYQAANVFASKDKGRTVSFWGRAQIPPKDRDCTENMVIERRDGTLWMLVRVKYGIAETFSSDGGKTWSELRPSAILNPNSRFFIGRLKSGAMLLVKNGPVGTKTGRSHITAFVSDDEGSTWLGGLVLDERNNVSYPDAVESADGFIHVVHDRERTKAREILHHRFTEADVRAGRLVTPGSRLKDIVNKAVPK